MLPPSLARTGSNGFCAIGSASELRARDDKILMELDWTQGELGEGRRCYDSGAFFEAHEHWESVWLKAPEPEKTFLQALIQMAAAFHHWRLGNSEGTVSLLRAALRRLDRFPDEFSGIAVEPLRTSIGSWIRALESVPPSLPPPFPRIELSE
jgi:uncharacterized protein